MTFPGLELLFESVRSSLTSQADAVVCLVHWNLTFNGFKCVKLGENIPQENERVNKSEMLPAGWNNSQEIYSLVYINTDGVYYILKVVKMDNTLLINLMRCNDEKVASMNARITQYATGNNTTYDEALTEIESFNQRMKKEVISEMKSERSATGGQTSDSRRGNTSRNQAPPDDPLRVPPRRPPATGQPDWNDPVGRFPGIGRGDLDPLRAGHGGGMFMDPMRGGMRGPLAPDHSAGLPGRLPRGAVPPGARFDPFGPPGAAPAAGPDPDHMRPPGYDDMFM